ncbi:unnamed protein product [Penicillium salamii]|uniref:Uncharacterized protein n=1 Tax=Penicillium salamii TaxID=1612424 RepID=A0A9W4NEV9_9EURO|nr:unnamed protein product [Penicillium salamii]CAG8023787.1 unnamed protein product [Penicillium salamii]CAG8215101.1 unnamed protein product [Penicillium salamii]CAG8301097.1 unnamed protein product [Penicillium salamii]CAG8324502.1 unnamed protein product [Penicillium salamii]
MPASLASSERSGSVKSHHSPKTSLQSKADPNMALYEQEPTTVNLEPGVRDTFSLRSIQHKDREGKTIADPDLSNPTRSRFERPLDTIRSFDAAIDAHHKQQRMR